MISKAATVAEYLAALPEDRRAVIQALRDVILRNLNEGYVEGVQYGMIGYCVPHSLYPAGYHCDPKQPLTFAALAAQKNHFAVYGMCVYSNPDLAKWFRQAWAKTGKKLDMGKSCIRFKKLDDAALDVIGELIRRVPVKKFIEHYEFALKSISARSTKKSATSRPEAKKTSKLPARKSKK